MSRVADAIAQLVHDVGKLGREADLEIARPRQIDGTARGDPSRAARHHVDRDGEKDRLALDHDMRKLGEDLSRANSRVSVARLELERLRRDAEKSVEQREKSRQENPAILPLWDLAEETALDESVRFATALLEDEALRESCELSPLTPINGPELETVVKKLDGSKIGVTLDGGRLTLRYTRSFAGECSEPREGAKCWEQIAAAAGIDRAAKPDCAAGYAKIKTEEMPVWLVLSRLVLRWLQVQFWYWLP